MFSPFLPKLWGGKGEQKSYYFMWKKDQTCNNKKIEDPKTKQNFTTLGKIKRPNMQQQKDGGPKT